jgi:excisionase family DNA binding protein
MPEVALLTVRESAERAGVQEGTVRRWIEHGKLPAIHVSPKVVRIHEHDLSSFLSSRRDGASTLAERLESDERTAPALAAFQQASGQANRCLRRRRDHGDLGAILTELARAADDLRRRLGE